MQGVAYLGAAALYLTLMFFVVRWAWRKGRVNGGSTTKASSYAFGGFLAVYLPVFWNWIPVVLTHRSLCNTDAGFVAYVTPEQWAAQNKDQFRQLVAVDLNQIVGPRERLASGFSQYKFFGGLLSAQERDASWAEFGQPFSRGERLVVDVRTGSVLTRSIDYSSGAREDARLWLPQLTCFDIENKKPSTLQNSFVLKLQEEIKK